MSFEGDYAQFRRGLLEKLAFAARDWARPKIPSKTLRGSMEVFVAEEFSAVRIAHYWALYIHDGTRSFFRAPTSQGKGVYLFFPNKRDDPRTSGGTAYPIRFKDTRRLTDSEYRDFLRRNRLRRKAGRGPVMVVVRQVLAGFPRPGVRFFDNRIGMAGFKERASDILLRDLGQFVSRQLPTDRGTLRMVL